MTLTSNNWFRVFLNSCNSFLNVSLNVKNVGLTLTDSLSLRMVSDNVWYVMYGN